MYISSVYTMTCPRTRTGSVFFYIFILHDVHLHCCDNTNVHYLTLFGTIPNFGGLCLNRLCNRNTMYPYT